MAMSAGTDDGTPMMDMNTTPLIDVMLVLLIMFIITIPVATHSVDIDLPVPSPQDNQPIVDPIKNKIVITEQDQILWNGNPITDGGLVANLQASMQLAEEPELQYEPSAAASYDRSLRVLDIIKGSGVTRFGFVGNEQYRTFGG